MSIKNRTLERGLPDWSNVRKVSNVVGMSDMGELAVRLGSPVSYDRRGDVAFVDGFEHGISSWFTNVAAPGGAVELSTLQPRSGAYLAKITTEPTDPDGTYFGREWPFPVVSAMGLEVSFRTGTSLSLIHFFLQIYTGTTYAFGAASYRGAAGTLTYADSTATPVTLKSGIVPTPASTLLHTVKVVVDFTTLQYRYILLDNETFDLSGVACYQTPSTDPPMVRITLQPEGDAVTNRLAYFDDVILTYNEP